MRWFLRACRSRSSPRSARTRPATASRSSAPSRFVVPCCARSRSAWPGGCRARCAGAHDRRSDRAVQITKKLIRVNKAVRSRRTWAKFGDCDGQEVGACLFVHAQGCGQDARPVSERGDAGLLGRLLRGLLGERRRPEQQLQQGATTSLPAYPHWLAPGIPSSSMRTRRCSCRAVCASLLPLCARHPCPFIPARLRCECPVTFVAAWLQGDGCG